MAEITVTTASVAVLDPIKSDIRSYFAAEAITAGQAVYFTTAGKVGVADANAAGKQQFRGIALQSVGAGSAVEVLHQGEINGFGVSALNGDAFVYLSDTAGVLADAAGTMTVPCGRVLALTNGSLMTKVLRVFVQWEAQWA